MRRTCRKRASSPLLYNPRGWSINPQSPAMVRGESHRATYRMHHFQSSRIYETGSSGGAKLLAISLRTKSVFPFPITGMESTAVPALLKNGRNDLKSSLRSLARTGAATCWPANRCTSPAGTSCRPEATR
jgi:hypothetical protein